MEGVRVPADVVNDGRAAAFASAAQGEISLPGDRAYCILCGTRNEFYDDLCRRCGGPKPWVHREELRVDDRQMFLRRQKGERSE